MRYHQLILFFLCLSLAACQDPTTPSNELGELHFQPTGLPDAQPAFEKGLLLLHSFEYEDAREAFLEAQSIDPDFAMAYWGEAMTYNHPLWARQLLEEGQEALQKLDSLPAQRAEKAATPIERDFLNAVSVLFGEGDRNERASAYKDQMAEMRKKYPKNHEASAFYALSLLGSVPFGRDKEVFEKSARIAESILAENPKHPGALHYLIHSYDDPEHAQLGKEAADDYSQVAPDAAHALHMPSHIYVAMGMWDEVVQSNIASWEASVNRMERKELDNKALNYHALHWLMYGLLQKKETERARQLLADMIRYCGEKPESRARSYQIAMQANYLIETGLWQDSLLREEVKVEDLNVSQQARQLFTKGMVAYQSKNASQLDSIIEQIDDIHRKAKVRVQNTGFAMCSPAPSSPMPNQQDTDMAEVMNMELKAMRAWLQNDASEARQWLERSCELEDAMSYSYGPPKIPKLSHELYGDWLLAMGEPDKAMEQYEAALQRGPGRLQTLQGKLSAAQQAGELTVAEQVQSTLQEI